MLLQGFLRCCFFLGGGAVNVTGGNERRIDRLMTHNPSVTPPTCLQNLHCMRGQWSYDEAADIILGLNSMRAKEAQILKESSWGSSVRAQARGRPESKAARAQPTLRSSGFTLGVLNSEYTGGGRGQKREHARTRSTLLEPKGPQGHRVIGPQGHRVIGS